MLSDNPNTCAINKYTNMLVGGNRTVKINIYTFTRPSSNINNVSININLNAQWLPQSCRYKHTPVEIAILNQLIHRRYALSLSQNSYYYSGSRYELKQLTRLC